jgi:hypothetical protein
MPKESSRYSQNAYGVVATGDHIGRVECRKGQCPVELPDYVAIGVLVLLIVWAAADWIPREKL